MAALFSHSQVTRLHYRVQHILRERIVLQVLEENVLDFLRMLIDPLYHVENVRTLIVELVSSDLKSTNCTMNLMAK